MAKERKFLVFYEKYKDKIFTYFWYRVGFSKHTAEDLTSDVFLKALKNFDTFDHSRSFRTWIYAIAKNHLADHYQKSGRELSSKNECDISGDSVDEINSHIDNKKEAAKILRHIHALKSYHREALLLRFVDGLSNKEISAMLGKAEGAVRAQISRALEALRKKLMTK